MTSSNSLDHNSDDDAMMLAVDAAVKEMEVAAIGYVAYAHKVPVIAFKVVTDIVDGDRPTQDEFLENLSAASKRLQEELPKVADFLLGKALSAL